jgi:hypothetical protein
MSLSFPDEFPSSTELALVEIVGSAGHWLFPGFGVWPTHCCGPQRVLVVHSLVAAIFSWIG